MLIHVHSSAVRLVMSGDRVALDALENVLRAHREAKHVASLERSDLDGLAGHGELSRQANGTISDLRFRNKEIRGLRQELPAYLELGDGPEFCDVIERRGSQQVLRVELRRFEDSETTQRAVLLAENRTDAIFYHLLGEGRAEDRRWSHVRVTFELRGGGGSQLAREFSQVADQGRVLLAIADSDQRCPGGSFGSTWNALRGVSQRPYQRAVALHVREAENLVPLVLLRESLPHRSVQSAIDRIQELERVSTEPWRAHADLKEGVTTFWIRRGTADKANERSFWKSVEQAALVAEKAGYKACDEPLPCNDEKGDEARPCSCFLVPSLGTKMLEAVVQRLKERWTGMSRYFDFDTDQRLAGLGDDLLCWGCSLAWVKRT
jgi:hypothetical protein